MPDFSTGVLFGNYLGSLISAFDLLVSDKAHAVVTGLQAQTAATTPLINT